MAIPAPSPEALATWEQAQADGYSMRTTRFGMTAVVNPDGTDLFHALNEDAAIRGILCNEKFGGCVLSIRNVDGFVEL